MFFKGNKRLVFLLLVTIVANPEVNAIETGLQWMFVVEKTGASGKDTIRVSFAQKPVIYTASDGYILECSDKKMFLGWGEFKSLTLEQRDLTPVTITANSYSREYGDANPVFEYTSEGATLDGEPEIICEATDTSSVGTYDIVVKQGSVKNYNVNYEAGKLTVTKAPLNIAAGTYTKKQGDAMPEFTLTYTGFKNDDTKDSLLKQPEITCDADETSAPGEYLVHLSGAEAKNYGIDYTDGKLIVTEADPVTITANSYSREYGEVNPVFEYTTEGATLDGEPEIICEATDTSSVGTYDIIVKQGNVKNYNVNYVAGKLTVTKAPLTVSVGNYSREFGLENPEFKLTYGGGKNGEDESVLLKKPIATTDATIDSPVGDYIIKVSGGEADNYTFEYINGVLTITPATCIQEIKSFERLKVYSVSGIKLNVTTLKQLPRGVYIVNGRKRIVR